MISYEGLTTRRTDAEGKNSEKVLDAFARVYRSVDHSGYYQQFEYDAFGSTRRVTDGPSQTNVLLENTYAYGIAALRVTSDDMGMGEWTYAPNALGEVTAYNDANTPGSLPSKVTATFSFDKLSRPLSRTEPEGVTTWTWGASSAENNIGRLASVSSPGHSESYDYDSNGRLIKRTIVVDATYRKLPQKVDQS